MSLYPIFRSGNQLTEQLKGLDGISLTPKDLVELGDGRFKIKVLIFTFKTYLRNFRKIQ